MYVLLAKILVLPYTNTMMDLISNEKKIPFDFAFIFVHTQPFLAILNVANKASGIGWLCVYLSFRLDQLVCCRRFCCWFFSQRYVSFILKRLLRPQQIKKINREFEYAIMTIDYKHCKSSKNEFKKA